MTKNSLDLISKDITYLQRDIDDIKKHYATKEDLVPLTNDLNLVKKIIFGAVSVIGLAVLGAWVNFIIK